MIPENLKSSSKFRQMLTVQVDMHFLKNTISLVSANIFSIVSDLEPVYVKI